MAVNLDIQSDFATIVDGVEAVTLKRRASAVTVAVSTAWRFSSLVGQAEPGMPGVAKGDVVWQFAWPASVDLPRIGDSIIDGTNECWTILSVEVRSANSRLRCVARNLRVVNRLDSRIEIQEAVWQDIGSGPEIVGWTTLRTAVPARIQPDRTTTANPGTQPTSTATYRVMLADETPLDHNHRLVGPDGAVYQLVEYADAERIDTLPVATVNKLPSL